MNINETGKTVPEKVSELTRLERVTDEVKKQLECLGIDVSSVIRNLKIERPKIEAKCEAKAYEGRIGKLIGTLMGLNEYARSIDYDVNIVKEHIKNNNEEKKESPI